MKVKENRIYKWATKKDYCFNQSPIDNILVMWGVMFMAFLAVSPFLLIIWLLERYY